MERTKIDKRKGFLLKCIIPFVKLWEPFNMKITREYHNFDPKREGAYIMLANHTFMFDVIHVPLYLKVSPYIVANENLFTKQPLKFVLNQIARAIPKSKGASDLRTAKELIKAAKKDYPILIFPEGDTTFNGETNYIEESTMKLIKKLKIDVVTCTVSGGYLSKPRWGLAKRRNRRARLVYRTILTKEELEDISLEEISEIINEYLYNNDYEYQREVMIKHPGKNRAKGIENVLYKCPDCEHNMTIISNDNNIECTHCGTLGVINDYGFIEGFKFDNIVDWDRYQKETAHELKDKEFESFGKLYIMNPQKQSRDFLGEVRIRYYDHAFYINGVRDFKVPFEEIKNPMITLRRNFNFIYKDTQYMIKIERYGASFLRVVQDKY